MVNIVGMDALGLGCGHALEIRSMGLHSALGFDKTAVLGRKMKD